MTTQDTTPRTKTSGNSVKYTPQDGLLLEVEDLFVVGYGLDFAGRYRNLPYVGALRQPTHSAGKPA